MLRLQERLVDSGLRLKLNGQELVAAEGFRTRRTGPSVSVLRAEALPASLLDRLGDGVRRPANLEDVFVLLTGERLED